MSTKSEVGEDATRVMGCVFGFIAEGDSFEGMESRCRAVLRVLGRNVRDAEDADFGELEISFRKRLKDCI